MSIHKTPAGSFKAVVSLPAKAQRTRTFRFKTEARAWEVEQRAALARGAWTDPRLGRTTLEEWTDTWLSRHVVEPSTMVEYQGLVRRQILPGLGQARLSTLRPGDVQSWVSRMQRDDVSAQTVRKAYTVLAMLLRAAARDRLIAETPCAGITLPASPDPIVRWFRAAEVEAIDAAIRAGGDRADLGLWGTMCWSGLRYGEAAVLTPADVDAERGVLAVRRSLSRGTVKAYPKSAASLREVPAPEWLLDVLADLPVRGDGPYLMARPKARMKPPAATAFNRRWREYLRTAGVPYLSPHTCRHTAASRLVQLGVPILDVAHFLGHKELRMTQRYAHLAPDRHERIREVWAAPRAQLDA